MDKQAEAEIQLFKASLARSQRTLEETRLRIAETEALLALMQMLLDKYQCASEPLQERAIGEQLV